MGRHRFLASLAVVLALVLPGCSYADREPGLFGRIAPTPTPEPPDTATPDLPVVGEAVWAAGNGVDLQVRVAVHALRRISGGTVLDYSLTPLQDDLHRPGEPMPPIDLGLLGAEAGDPQIFLVETQSERLYRPKLLRSWHRTECLCTPVAQVQQSLHVGRTTVLQVVFPELATHLSTIDVDLASVPPFWNVPVTAEGMVPLATAPTDLARPADPAEPSPSTGAFRSAGGQVFDITVDAVQTSRSYTALAWTIRSLTTGPGLAGATAPPFREAGVAGLVRGSSAGSPTLQPSGRAGPVLRSRLIPAGSARRCLCTDLSRPSDLLRSAGHRVSAVTVLPPVPQGTSAVDVSFPGAARLVGVATTTASDGAFRSAGPVRQPVGTWTESNGRPLGWSTQDWPTPLPSRRAVDRFPAAVSPLLR